MKHTKVLTSVKWESTGYKQWRFNKSHRSVGEEAVRSLSSQNRTVPVRERANVHEPGSLPSVSRTNDADTRPSRW